MKTCDYFGIILLVIVSIGFLFNTSNVPFFSYAQEQQSRDTIITIPKGSANPEVDVTNLSPRQWYDPREISINVNDTVKWINNDTQTNVLSDLDVDKGSLFDKNNRNVYDIIILGHQEYVTQKEYDNFKQFVSNGGIIILLDGNVFYAEVRYFDNNNTISLVKGHGWAYNGKTAWKSVNERWKDETKDWVGSNYFCYMCVKIFKDNPFGYIPHEEQYVSNPKDIILLNYNPLAVQNTVNKNITIAKYELNYGKGIIIAIGIYSDDIIQNKEFDRFFDNLIVKYALHSDTK